MLFGDLFREYRKNARLSQKQVADLLGIRQSNISNWEKNKNRPEYEHLIALAKLYQVTIEELLGAEGLR